MIITPLLRAETSAALPAPLPELMNDEQAAKWSAAQEAAATTASANEPSNQFYTGKPYVADAGGYVYKYRTYSPEMSRWTSADPSGFPDSANNQMYVTNPMNQVDPLGLYNEDEILEGSTTVLGGAVAATAGFTVLAAAGPETGGLTLFGAAAAEFLGINSMILGAATIAEGVNNQTTFIPQSLGGAVVLAISTASGADQTTAQLLSTTASDLEEVFGPSPEIKGISRIIRTMQSDAEKLDALSTQLQADLPLRPATQNGQPGYE